MAKKKNSHGIRARVTTTGTIELWLGNPGAAESECIAQFNKDYLPSVKYVLDIINKAPIIDSNMIYGMAPESRCDDYYCADNGFLKRGADKCPDCNVSLHWRLIGGMRIFETIDGKSFYQSRCPTCHSNWMVRK